MSDSDSCLPDDILSAATAVNHTLPEKSTVIYREFYSNFREWMT